MAATNQQIQQWANERTRVRAEQIRALLLAMEDDRAAFDGIYAALVDPACDWTDVRTDGPPNLLAKNDLLGINAFIDAMKTAMRAHDQLPVVLKACVRSVRLEA
jgi:hypothetical protein